MAQILTFLGQGGTTALAIATAKQLAASGQRVLLVVQSAMPGPAVLLGQALSAEPVLLGDGLWAVQLHTATLLQKSWQALKELEAQYLRTPFLTAIYGQELGVLPGMDSALALNALREYDASSSYDAIVYAGSSSMETLRMLGLPEILDWYIRRFRGVFQQSDLGRVLSPFIQPIAAAVLTGDWGGGDMLDQPTGQMRSLLEQGRDAVSDPNRVLAFLVTTPAADAVATARYLWGSAQQIGLTVGGAFIYNGQLGPEQEGAFAPLPHFNTPSLQERGWEGIMATLPDPQTIAAHATRSTLIDRASKTVMLFLPSFDKGQVKLTQYGPEVTVEAGDQRRNLLLPPELQGRSVTGAKFQDQYLVISFG
ncbi:MAG: ArsA family ATPase [Leptolyngbyaceae cyanobacterium SM2_5_2]|nr:ArsA family ATPase [Leptolyngbyaceae cyanobacterium SM2_5_2]